MSLEKKERHDMDFLPGVLARMEENKKTKAELNKETTNLLKKAGVLLETYGQVQNNCRTTASVTYSQYGKKVAMFYVCEIPVEVGFRIRINLNGEEEDFFVVEHSKARNWLGECASTEDIQDTIKLITALQEALEKRK